MESRFALVLHSSLLVIGVLAAASSSLAATNPALWRRIDSSSTGVLPAPAATLVEPTAARVLDVDGDGDNDFIIAGRKGPPALTLWRYNAGRWAPEVIEPDSLRIEAGGASHDIDGDGDQDVVFGGDNSSGNIWWWENPYPKTGRWARHVIKSDKPTKHHDMIFGDFDGDGRAELVAWNQNGHQLIRFIIPNNPKSTSPWPFTTLFRWEGAAQHEGLAAIDVDGDGVTDIVGAGRWFRHAGEGRFTEEIVDPAMTFTRAVAGQFVTGMQCVGHVHSPPAAWAWSGNVVGVLPLPSLAVPCGTDGNVSVNGRARGRQRRPARQSAGTPGVPLSEPPAAGVSPCLHCVSQKLT
ncbi:MAG: VCBS repeat-containing protein [Chloroflexi bacterium CFX7]|nr:VCBS repeat-containing protein [Chloroflexi bacterium CFX7]